MHSNLGGLTPKSVLSQLHSPAFALAVDSCSEILSLEGKEEDCFWLNIMKGYQLKEITPLIRGWKKRVFINGSNRAKTMIYQNIFRKKGLETIISIHLQPSHLSTHAILKQDLKSLWKLHTRMTVSSKKRKSQMFLSWGGWELCKRWELSYSHLTPKEAGFAP